MENPARSIHYKPVIVGYEDWPPGLDEMLDWCKDNAQGKWAYGLHHGPPDVRLVCAFYFDNTEDYCTFSLIWGLT